MQVNSLAFSFTGEHVVMLFENMPQLEDVINFST